MSDNEMLYCLIAFIIGWLASRHMGNGFSIGGEVEDVKQCSYDVTKNDINRMKLVCDNINNAPELSDFKEKACGLLNFCKFKSVASHDLPPSCDINPNKITGNAKLLTYVRECLPDDSTQILKKCITQSHQGKFPEKWKNCILDQL